MVIAEFIDARLDEMLSHPLNWGGAEAFELQVLLLLELRQFLRGGSAPSPSLRTHLDAYSSFLRMRFPALGPRPLSAVSSDAEEIARHLEEFRASLSVPGEGPSVASAPPAPDSLGIDVEVTAEEPTKPRAA
jgi:hypothetical protein